MGDGNSPGQILAPGLGTLAEGRSGGEGRGEGGAWGRGLAGAPQNPRPLAWASSRGPLLPSQRPVLWGACQAWLGAGGAPQVETPGNGPDAARARRPPPR